MQLGDGTSWVGHWKPEKVIEAAEAEVSRALGASCAYLTGQIKRMVGRPGMKPSRKFGVSVLEGKKVARGTEGADITRVSRPGEPPRVRTGTLRNSIHYEKIDARGLSWKVGSPLKYAAALELGTTRGLAPRPFLRTALALYASDMQAIIASKLSKLKFKGAKFMAPWSSELTSEDVSRAKRTAQWTPGIYRDPPAMGEK